MKVEDVMSINPLSIRPGEFVTRAREIMRDNKIDCLPILRNGRYDGMITIQDIINVTSTKSDVTVDGYIRKDIPSVSPETDIASAAKKIISTDAGRMPVLYDNRLAGILSIGDVFKGVGGLGLADVPVSEVMTRKVAVCEPEDPISRVWRDMTEFNISGFPVVRRNQEVIGVITRRDILTKGYVRLSRESEFSRTTSVVQMIMSTPAITIREDESTIKAAKIFSERMIGRLPVVKNGSLTGIVDRYDVLKVCRRLLPVE